MNPSTLCHEEQLKGAMEGKTLVDVGRRGKQLWFTFAGRGTDKDGPSVLFHFGMTGAFVVKGMVRRSKHSILFYFPALFVVCSQHSSRHSFQMPPYTSRANAGRC